MPLTRHLSLTCCLILFFGSSPLLAQQHTATARDTAERESTERETLAQPMPLPPPVGLYKDLQQIPESVRRSAPFARELVELERHAGADGTFDREQRVEAFEQSKRDLLEASLEQQTAAAKSGSGSSGSIKPLTDAWTNIGLHGSAGQNVFSSGCVAAIAIDPTNTSTMYVGPTSGGVWKSIDEGANWTALTDDAIPNLSVASIAIDPHHTGTLYVGTGNGYASINNITGTGLYKSEDGGGTWSHIGATTLTGTVVKVLVHPVNTGIILAAQYAPNPGLYRSVDSGVTWTKVFPTTGYSAGVVWDIVASNVNGFVSFYFAEGNNLYSASQECGVYKSVDNGATWAKYSTGFPRGDSIGRCAIAGSVAHPERVFVFMANPLGDVISSGTRSLFRTTNSGASWSAVSIPSTVFAGSQGQAAQGWYDCILGVTPFSNGTTGSDSVYIGGIEAWVNYFDGTGWQEFCDPSDSWVDTHVDHHSIAFDPKDPSIVFNGNNGGLYWSDGGAGAPGTYQYRSNGMVTNRFYHVALDHNATQYLPSMVGAQDQGTWRLPGGTQTPVLELGGDGMQPILNSANGTYPKYGELPAGELYRYSNAGWHQIGGKGFNFNDDAFWDAPFKQSIAPYGNIAAYHVFWTGRDSLWLSTNDGTNWKATSGTTFSGGIRALGLSLLTYSDIFVGTGSQIMYSSDAGATWSTKIASTPTVSSIVRTGHDDQFVLVSALGTGANHLIRSTDKGAHWQNRSGTAGHTLPAVNVNCVALDSVDPLRVWYAATDNGIYYTLDSGNTWSVAGAGIGLAPCYDVEVQANKTTIRVATFGRGLWEGNTNLLPVELSSLSYIKTKSGTALSWHTDSERGDAGFWVERSVGGEAFDDLNFVPSQASGGQSSVRLDYQFVDTLKTPGTYLYQLKQTNLDGSVSFSNHVEVHWGTDQMIVYQNYPNPLLIGTPSAQVSSGFNPFGTSPEPFVTPSLSTRINYELPFDQTSEGDLVTISIYNSLGKFVAYAVTPDGQPVNNLMQQAGMNSAFWNGHAGDGTVVSSGAYFYVLQTQHSGSFTGKMALYSN